MRELIITDSMVNDLLAYYRNNPAETKINMAASYLDQVEDQFYGNEATIGTKLPWSKTHNNIKLRPGEVSVWAGVNGHGKSMLLSQIMLDAMHQGEKVVIASMEMPIPKTLKRMTQQAAGCELPTKEFIVDFHGWLVNKLWLYDKLGTVKSQTLLAVMRYCAEKIKPNHFVIDSLMKCGMGVDEYNKQKAFIDELTAFAMDTGIHVHLVAHSRKRENEKGIMDKFDVKGAGEITDMADNVFTVWRNKHKEIESKKPVPGKDIMDQPDAILMCDKQRHGDYEGRIGLWFNGKAKQFVANQDRRPIQNSYNDR